MTGFGVGDVVKVQRDEKRYPPRGSWPKYRGRVGTVVIAGRDGEVGVAFQPTWLGEDGKLKYQGSDTTWFLPRELVPSTPQQLHAQG